MANTRVYWLHALSPTHVGTGRGVGYVDLPVDREGVTNWPVVRGSAFKGVWADHHGATDDNRKRENDDRAWLLRAAFGISSGADNQSNAGSLVPTDARLVCLPVRSFRGTFAWCTSRLAIQLLHRFLKPVGFPDLPTALPDAAAAASGRAFVTSGSALTEKTPAPNAPPAAPGPARGPAARAPAEKDRLYLEDLDFEAEEDVAVAKWAGWIGKSVFPADDGWQAEFEKRFVVLPDGAFDFLAETGTEVFTRVKIDDDTKTVKDGHLWTEEAVPAETIFVGVVACDRVYPTTPGVNEAKLLTDFCKDMPRLQIGGKATVGRGQVRCVFTDPSAAAAQPANPNGGAR